MDKMIDPYYSAKFHAIKFQTWLEKNYPDVMEEYEFSDAVEYLELHEWIARGQHWRLEHEWRKEQWPNFDWPK